MKKCPLKNNIYISFISHSCDLAVSDWEDTLNRVAAGAFASTASITNGINEDGQNEQESKPEHNLHENFISSHVSAVFNDPHLLSIITSHGVSVSVNSEITISLVNLENDIYFLGLNEFLNFLGGVRVVSINFINWDIEDSGISCISFRAWYIIRCTRIWAQGELFKIQKALCSTLTSAGQDEVTFNKFFSLERIKQT